MITRAGMNARFEPAAASGHDASDCTSASLTCSDPARRSRFSSSTQIV